MKTLRNILPAFATLAFAGLAYASPTTFHNNDGWIGEGTFGQGANPAEFEGLDQQTNATASMWYPRKAAFRAGRFSGSRWESGEIGNYSVAFGEGLASGDFASALGTGQATGDYATAVGASYAFDWYATATGGWTDADGFASFSGGEFSYSGGTRSFAFGSGTASATSSTAFGSSTASALHSTAFGTSTASGNYSTAFGQSIQANARSAFAVGRFNVGGGNSSSWVETDPLFEVGNGTSGSNRSNAMTVYKNGDAEFAGVVRIEPAGDIGMGQFTSSP